MNIFSDANPVNAGTLGSTVTLIILLTVMSVIVLGLVIYMIGRYHALPASSTLTMGRSEKEGRRIKTVYLLMIVIVVGVVVRLLFTLFLRGFQQDASNTFTMVKNIINSGFPASAPSLPPLLVYIYVAFGSIGVSGGATAGDASMIFLLNLPNIIADIVMAIAIYRISTKYMNRYVGLALGGMYMLLPIFFVASGMWGTPYSIYIAVVFFAFYFLAKRNIYLMSVFMVAMYLILPESVFLAPIFLSYLGYLFVRAIISLTQSKSSFDAAMNDRVQKNIVDVPVSLVISVSVVYLLSLPVYMNTATEANFFLIYAELFSMPIAKLSYFSQNALSIFTMFGQNFVGFGNVFPSAVFALLFLALITAVTLVIFLSKRNRANLILLAAYIVSTVSIYFVGSNEWTFLPSLALLILSFIIIQDKRILKIFGIFAITSLIANLLVMYHSGSISGTVDAASNRGMLLLTGDTAGSGIFLLLLAIVQVITHIYFTVAMLDITMAKRRVIFPDDSIRMTMPQIIRSWLFNR